jgi:Fe-S oxidoreductase
MRALPLLEPRRAELEKCVFCPKLCRSACPVSNAEPRETITPWGKMSAAWMSAHGDTALDRSHAAPAWACTGCFGCREACDHRNPVTDVLLDARDALVRSGAAPESATRVLAGFPHHDAETRAAARALASDARCDAHSTDALLVGCGYLHGAPRETKDALDAATRICKGSVAIVEACCGLPLRLAGDVRAFARHANHVASQLARYARVVVVDAGCALTLRQRFLEAGAPLLPRVELLVEAAARMLPQLSAVPRDTGGPVRWHDPCQLGRGLGVYEAPRAILARALGRAPDEFDDRREYAVCSGAGGLLPATMPEVAKRIADARLEAHALAGGGRVVTACASSLMAMRKSARGSGVQVDDLVTWIAGSLRPRGVG